MRFSQLSRPVALSLVTLLAGTLMLTSGCKNNQQEEMKKELEALKQENASMKTELDTLKTTTAQAQPATELTTTSSTSSAETPSGGYPKVSPQSYSDVTADVPTADMINDLALLKIFDGVTTEFKPFQPITRGEYIIWLYKAYNAQRTPDKQLRLAPVFPMPFTDLPKSHPSYKYVQALANGGFSVGYENKTFQPDKALTREEMIAIKHGVDGAEMYSNGPTEYTDDKLIDKRYHNDVYSDNIFKKDGPRGNNIMRAFGPTKTFKPKETVLRYEAAATLWQTDHRGRNTADIALGRGDN